jgi:hypothetical protein
MTAPLVTRSAGDIIFSSDHNDVMAYVESGTYRVNTTYVVNQPVTLPTSLGTVGVIAYDTSISTLKFSNNGGTAWMSIGSESNDIRALKFSTYTLNYLWSVRTTEINNSNYVPSLVGYTSKSVAQYYNKETSQGVIDTAVTGHFIFGGTIYDAVTSGTIDDTKWTNTGASIETGTAGDYYIRLDNNDICSSNGSSGLDMIAGKYYILFDADSTSSDLKIFIRNTAGTQVEVLNVTESRRAYLLYHDNTTNKVYKGTYSLTTKQWTLDAGIDVSSVTGQRFIKFQNDGGGSQLKLYKVCYWQNTGSNQSCNFFGVMKTLTASSTSAIMFIDGTSNNTTDFSTYISTNNGSNYTTMPRTNPVFITTTDGTQCIIKVTGYVNGTNPDVITHIGGFALV